ncbi:MAG TPA: hypothetical protein VFV38_35045 [Ktedonobacteraceae bacterium]|nr:hypothetical protein [Ktedonobacteraceae bacterium]
MQALRDFAGQPLEWFRIDAHCYKLQGHGETLAVADWGTEGNAVKNVVVGRIEDRRWLLRGTGLLSREVRMYAGDARDLLETAPPLGLFAFDYQKERQEFRLTNGRGFIWTWKRSATPTLVCSLPGGQEVLRVQTLRQRLFHPVECIIEISPQEDEIPELSLLLFLGLYLGRLAIWSAEHDLKRNPRAWLNLLLSFFEGFR